MRLFVITIVLCAGCAGPKLSDDVLEIARATTRAGAFHLEFDSDGGLVEAGGAVELNSVPAACRAAVDKAHPGGTQTGAERVYADGSKNWMVAKEIDGRVLEVLVDDDGKILGGEEELPPTRYPSGVVSAAQAAVSGATLERVERVWGSEAHGEEAFHLKFNDHGESVRVGVSDGAKIVRIVRRLAGQVRVPR